MRTVKIYAFLILLMLLPAFIASAQKTDLSGEWKLNKDKVTNGENQLILSKITIQLKSDSLLTTRVYENGMGEEYPFVEKLSLDGKECKIVLLPQPHLTEMPVRKTWLQKKHGK